MAEKREPPFFIGYLPAPQDLRGWLIGIAAGLVILFALVSYAIGITQDDPGPGAFRFDLGEQTVSGVVQARPYPLLYVSGGSEKIAAGRTIMLVGAGKTGVMAAATKLDGVLVQVSELMIKRGDLDMLQVNGELAPSAGVPKPPPIEKLGRWRLAGEICDGKCTAGAMSPGRGLAHKACANLCIAGGAPPVFVSSKPVAGSEFLLMASADGGPLPDWLYDQTALYVSLEGEVEKRGDLLIFRVDPATLKVL